MLNCPKMSVLRTILAVGVISLMTAACDNTLEGFGDDVKDAGDAVERETD